MDTKKHSNALPIAALISVQVIFGLNFVASKIILAHYPAVLWGAIRLGVASLIMLLVSFVIVPKAQRRYDYEFFKFACIFGVIGIAISQTLFLLGVKYTSTTNAAILNALTPIFTLLLAILAGTEKMTLARGLGFSLALVGAIVIRDFHEFRITSDTFKGDVFTILNCLILALFFVMSRDFLKKTATFWATAWMFFFASISLFIASASDLSHFVPEAIDSRLIFAIFYNIVMAGILTYFFNSWALTKVSSSFVAIFIYLQPAVALLHGWYVGGEPPGMRVMLAITLIFTGVGITALKRA